MGPVENRSWKGILFDEFHARKAERFQKINVKSPIQADYFQRGAYMKLYYPIPKKLQDQLFHALIMMKILTLVSSIFQSTSIKA